MERNDALPLVNPETLSPLLKPPMGREVTYVRFEREPFVPGLPNFKKELSTTSTGTKVDKMFIVDQGIEVYTQGRVIFIPMGNINNAALK